MDGLAAPRLTLLCREHRGGYGAAINEGARHLRTIGLHYLWALNNDVLLQPGALAELVQAAEAEPEVGVWGSTVIKPGPPPVLECAGGCRYHALTSRIEPLHAGRRLDELEVLPEADFDYVAGAAMFCRAEHFFAMQGFSEDYFLYFEELDFARRMPQTVGLRWCRNSIVCHMGGGSTGEVGRQRSSLQQYYENLSTLRFTRRYHPACLLPVLLARLLGKPLLFLARGEWHLFRPFGLAMLDFLTGRAPRRWSR
jgi:GT2 family glycosyltransferase